MSQWTKTTPPNKCGNIKVKPIGNVLEMLERMGVTIQRTDYDPPMTAWVGLNELMASVEDKSKHTRGAWRSKTAEYHIERAVAHITKWQNREKVDADDGNHHLINAFSRIGMAFELDQPQAEEP